MLALFRRVGRWLHGDGVRAPQEETLSISKYERGVIKVELTPFREFLASSSPDDGNTVWMQWGDTPFQALSRLMYCPVKVSNLKVSRSNLKAFQESLNG